MQRTTRYAGARNGNARDRFYFKYLHRVVVANLTIYLTSRKVFRLLFCCRLSILHTPINDRIGF